MNNHGGFGCSVHGDTASLANLSEGQDIRKRARVKPYGTEVGEITDETGKLAPPIGEDCKCVPTAADVPEVPRVLENTHGGLAIE